MARPITNTTTQGVRARELYHQKRHLVPGPCPDCGANKSNRAVRCRPCSRQFRTEQARKVYRNRYHREYMRRYRGMTPDERTRLRQNRDMFALRQRALEPRTCRMRECLYFGYEHHHCECGLGLAPSENACPMCLAEQARIEFKTWPKEKVA